MLPAQRRVLLASRRAIGARYQHVSARDKTAPPDQTNPSSSSARQQSSPLTGAAKLFADALEEESAGPSSSRDHLRHTQGPIWTGDETQHDAVLRMLVDAHKPLRSGSGVKHNSADEKIKGWMKGLKLEPRLGSTVNLPAEATEDLASEDAGVDADIASKHRTTIPPHLHRPWHATYTGSSQDVEDVPKIRYGAFMQKRATGDSLANALELQLPPGADGKTRARVKEARRAGRVVRRFENAREGAIDYKLGASAADIGDVGDDEEQFRGNRQMKGSSVLGAQKGGASGLRAWAGLVEDRIQRAREAGFFKVSNGKGKPIPRDPEAGNPHIEHGELLMNRIVKRQGALPPWIELQNSLDSTLNAFRNTLASTYITHLVRVVMSTNSSHALPALHTIPANDEAWEARERKFHEENVKQINDLVRRMNAQAPPVVRRPLVTLEAEMSKVRGETLRAAVWEEIQRRSLEAEARQKSNAANIRSTGPGYLFEPESFARLRQATRRSLSTITLPVASVLGRARHTSGGGYQEGGHSGDGQTRTATEPGETHSDPSRSLLIVLLAGGGLAAVTYYRRPVRNDSAIDLIPLQPSVGIANNPTDIVASSPAEPHLGVIGTLRAYILEPFLTFLRFFHLACLFGPVILTAPMIFIGKPDRARRRRGKPVLEDEENWGAVWWYGFLVKQMERAGPSFIKLGQWAASRADLFPASLCDKMSKLHSNGDPHSMRHTRRVIERAFGMKMSEIFEHFDETPIGCGAIAQVYRATLSPEILSLSAAEQTALHPDTKVSEGLTGSVAIKVLHPRVAKTVRRDIAIMSVFANIVNALPGMQWISLPEEVQVFGQMMNSQLDLRVEASNLDHFDRNFTRRGRMIKFPRAIRLGKDGNGNSNGNGVEESKDVLIEEFEDALPLKYFLRNGGGPYDDKIANIGLDAFLEMLLLDNWTHGDLHPGNIMVRFYKPSSTDYLGPLVDRITGHHATPSPAEALTQQSRSSTELVHSLQSQAHDPEAWRAHLEQLDAEGYAPQLIFIDAGLVTSLNDKNRKDFIDLFAAVAEFDGYKAGKLMVERCRTPEYVVDEETFALKMQHLILSVKSKTFSLAKIKISDILSDVLTAVRQHHVKLEGDFVNTVISILLLEGIGRQLDPNMDLFKSALPILRQLGRQMGTREAIAATPTGNIWAMVKLWVWIEARDLAGNVSAFDEWIKYDRLTPAI